MKPAVDNTSKVVSKLELNNLLKVDITTNTDNNVKAIVNSEEKLDESLPYPQDPGQRYLQIQG